MGPPLGLGFYRAMFLNLTEGSCVMLLSLNDKFMGAQGLLGAVGHNLTNRMRLL